MAKIPINKFDKFIKDQVERHQTPVDTDRLWSNIQKVGRSKKTSILPGALLLLLVSLFVSVHLLNKENSLTNNTASRDQKIEISTLSLHENPSKRSGLNPNPSINTKAQSTKIQDDLKSSVTFKKTNYSSAKGNAVQTNVDLHPDSGLLSAGNTALAGTEEVTATDIETAIASAHTTTFEASIPINLMMESVSGDLQISQNINEERLSDFTALSRLTNYAVQGIQTEFFFPELKLFPQSSTRIQHAKSKNGFELRLNGGVGMVFRNMELLNPEADQWMQSRMNNEKQLESVRLGLDLKFRITRNVYFFAGMEDFRINERFDYNSVEEITYTKDGLAAREVHDENSFTVEEGPVDIFEEIHKRGTFYNQFRMINIPFGIGVNQQYGRFSLGLEASVLINAFHRFEGKMANAANALVEMQDVGMKVSQIQSARINGVFSYQLNSRWGLNLFTGADLPLRAVQLDQHMSQSYLVWHGNLGISYNW